MEIYALVGPSGTGKSHHATELADELQISYIIDDGLLIHNGKKLAGVSAKSEPTMVAAVKRAIFLDQEHAESVRKAHGWVRLTEEEYGSSGCSSWAPPST